MFYHTNGFRLQVEDEGISHWDSSSEPRSGTTAGFKEHIMRVKSKIYRDREESGTTGEEERFSSSKHTESSGGRIRNSLKVSERWRWLKGEKSLRPSEEPLKTIKENFSSCFWIMWRTVDCEHELLHVRLHHQLHQQLHHQLHQQLVHFPSLVSPARKYQFQTITVSLLKVQKPSFYIYIFINMLHYLSFIKCNLFTCNKLENNRFH